MSEKDTNPLNNIQNQIENISKSSIISDTQVVSREKRMQQTPNSNGEWILFRDVSGPRGMCEFHPSDQERIDLLARYGTDCVKYSINGEPDFSDFSEMQVKISNMEGGTTQSRAHNFANANRKLAGTKWAEERGLKTQTDIQEYIRQNKLTWHEKSDGVTMQLVPSAINGGFGHVGGVSTIASLDADDSRVIGHSVGVMKVKIAQSGVKIEESFQAIKNNANNFIDESTTKFISKDFSRINRAGINGATEAAIFAGTLSIVRNTAAVVRGNKTGEEAKKDILVDTTTTVTTAYATGALTEKFSANIGKNEAALIVTGTIQITKQVVDYANGKIDEKQFVTAVAETGAYLVAGYIGKCVGCIIGGGVGVGAEIGKVVGEIVTTAVCSEVISTIKFSKEFTKRNKKIISLYRHAEWEIRESQLRLEEIIQKENNELISAIDGGFNQIYKGIQDDSYEGVREGILTIAYKFGLSEKDFERDLVNRENIFARTDEVLVIE